MENMKTIYCWHTKMYSLIFGDYCVILLIKDVEFPLKLICFNKKNKKAY